MKILFKNKISKKDKKLVNDFIVLFEKRLKDHAKNGGCVMENCHCAFCIFDRIEDVFKIKNEET